MRGGKREGAGRKLGSVSRIDAEARQKALAGGIAPVDFLVVGHARRKPREARACALMPRRPPRRTAHARLASTELSGPNKSPRPHPEGMSGDRRNAGGLEERAHHFRPSPQADASTVSAKGSDFV